MAKSIVLYHGGCPDGFGAALAAWWKLKDTAVYIPCFHYKVPDLNSSTPPSTHPNLYILDFSFPADVLKKWQSMGYKLVLLDHHSTAKKRLQDIKGCHFDMTKSGAILSYEHFFGSDPPALLRYVQDHDLFRFELPFSHEIMYWLRSQDFDFALWTKLSIDMVANWKRIKEAGQEIARYAHAEINRVMGKSKIRWLDICGNRVPVVNTSVYSSEIGNLLCVENDAIFAATYFDTAEDKRQWSFRSIGGYDVGELATSLGGGGHERAAGCTLNISDSLPPPVG